MRMVQLRSAGIFAVLAFILLGQGRTAAAGQWAAPAEASAYSIPTSELLQPQQLNQILQSPGAEKPLLFQVGSRVLFEQAHIPHSEYIGLGMQEAGTQALRNRVAKLPHKTFIVLYCGCCPWNRCPNVGPTYKLLVDMGFTHVKVLYLADNFGADWASKGYPVESTH